MEDTNVIPDFLTTKSDFVKGLEAEAQAKAQEEAAKNQPRFVDLVGVAADEAWVSSQLDGAAFNQDFTYDPEWSTSDETKQQMIEEFQGNDNYTDFIFQSTSQEEFDWRVERSRAQKENEEMLANAGMEGIAATLVAGVSDPALLPLYLTPWGAAGNTVKAVSTSARIARYAKAGMIVGGVEGTALGGIEWATKPGSDEIDALYMMLGGTALGGAAGAIQGKLMKHLELEQLTRSGVQLTDKGKEYFADVAETNIENLISNVEEEMLTINGGNLSAAKSESISDRALRQDTAENIEMFEQSAPRVSDNIFNTLGVRKALSAVSRTGQSENPVVRYLGQRLGLVSGDIDADSPVTMPASIWKQMMDDQYRTEFYRAYRQVDFGELTRESFNEQVARYIRGEAVDGLTDSGRQFAEETRKLLTNMLGQAQKAGVKGFDNVVEDAAYLPRIYDQRKLDNAIQKYGLDSVRRMFADAIQEAQPDIEEELLDKIANGYLNAIRSRGMTGGAGIPRPDSPGVNLDHIRNALLDEGVSEEIIDRVTLAPSKNKPKDVHARRRLQISETAPRRIRLKDADPYDTEAYETITMQDFLVNDIEDLFSTYTHRMTGGMGLARMGIDSDESFETLLAKANDAGNALGLSREETVKELNALRFMYDSIRGKYNLQEGIEDGTRNNLRRLREFNYVRMMGQAGLAATIELANVVAENGLRRAFKEIPQLGKLVKTARDGKLDDELQREIEAFTGIGGDIVNGGYVTRFDDPTQDTIITSTQSKVDQTLGKARRFVSIAGGLAPVTVGLQRLNARLFSKRVAENLMSGKKVFSDIKLKQLGLNQQSLNLIKAQISKYAEFDGKNLKTLNLKDWDDEIAADKFRLALRVDTTQNVQVTNIGSMTPWLRTEVGKTAGQFMSYTVGANEQQYARNAARLRNGDFTPLKTFMGVMVTGSLTYIARVYANAVGRDDAQKYIEERLSPAQMARGVMSYYGGLGIFSIAMGGGWGANTLIENPTAGLIKSIGDIPKALEDGSLSEKEVRSMMRLLPAQNVLVINQLLNATASTVGD